MGKIGIVLACLACIAHGQRESSRSAHRQKSLATMLLASQAAPVAFNSMAPAGQYSHRNSVFAQPPSTGRASLVNISCAQAVDVSAERMERLKSLKDAAKNEAPFCQTELDSAVTSMHNAAGEFREVLDWAALRNCLQAVAHEPYKNWSKTEHAAESLSTDFLSLGFEEFQRIFQRVFRDGHWDAAAKAAANRTVNMKPWIVLVTGLNGIRKTTCMYQPWFKKVLHDAIRHSGQKAPAKEELPDGHDSFFRQLDHIIATVANEEFRTLYKVKDVNTYSALKDGIFARYRKIAEMWGILLVKEAKAKRLNVMVETSGRDPSMFQYIDHFFPDDSYRKLVLHFEVNDIAFAESSVDSRMSREMADGVSALAGTAEDIIKVNAGGPYGSKVLQDVLAGSNRVWEKVLGGEIANSWHKASISIKAQEGVEWTARATMAPPDTESFTIEKL